MANQSKVPKMRLNNGTLKLFNCILRFARFPFCIQEGDCRPDHEAPGPDREIPSQNWLNHTLLLTTADSHYSY